VAKRKAESAGTSDPVTDYPHKGARRKNNPPAKIATEGTVGTPYAMAVDSVANQVYVANFGGDNATVIHATTSH